MMGCSVRPSCSNATGRNLGAGASSSRRRMPAATAPVTTTTSSISSRRPLHLRRQQFSSKTTAVSATRTTRASPAIADVGTQIIKRVTGSSGGPGADAVFVPAGGADTLFGRRLIYSLLRAGKKVVAGAFILFFFVHLLQRSDKLSLGRTKRGW